MSTFGAQSTADEVLEGVDMTDKIVFITGGASGLGEETARAMAARGARVVIAARDPQKLESAAERIREASGQGAVETMLLDLADLKSVRRCGEEANARLERIDILINNAGVMACPLMRTADGFEMQFGTNHLGHFLLTKYLLGLVEKGADKRIVNLSSRGHHIAPVDFDDPNYERGEYDKWQAYGRSKTANILFSVALEKRFGARGIHANALHPGGIVTNLGRHMTEEDTKWIMQRVEEAQKMGAGGMKTIPQGAATTCWVATALELEGKGGLYCEDCHIAEVDDESLIGGVRSYALDEAKAERLWALSEELVGERFDA